MTPLPLFLLAQAATDSSSVSGSKATPISEAKSLMDARSIDDLKEQTGVIWDLVMDGVITFGPKLLLALILFFVGLFLIMLLRKFVSRALKIKKLDPAVSGFILSLISIGLRILLVIMVLGVVGVPTASLGFVIGAASLAIGFAMKNTLANFASGILILILKPFSLGDFIEAKGFSGTVREIQMFNTVMTTLDNKRVIIPNSDLSSSSLINYSSEKIRRIDVVFGIGYEDDIDHAFSVLKKIVNDDQRTHTEPEPLIKVVNLGDNSVDINVRVWVDSGDFGLYKMDLLETVKKTFDAEGISFPFPQREVTLHQAASSGS
ncbi:MAG: mechanosensitive ion channel protein MscS [Planctomycetaceae bacterium]|nr:mechanosensitive ion channel protein MscS [Planctomycetaceae bacterium]